MIDLKPKHIFLFGIREMILYNPFGYLTDQMLPVDKVCCEMFASSCLAFIIKFSAEQTTPHHFKFSNAIFGLL